MHRTPATILPLVTSREPLFSVRSGPGRTLVSRTLSRVLSAQPVLEAAALIVPLAMTGLAAATRQACRVVVAAPSRVSEAPAPARASEGPVARVSEGRAAPPAAAP